MPTYVDFAARDTSTETHLPWHAGAAVPDMLLATSCSWLCRDPILLRARFPTSLATTAESEARTALPERDLRGGVAAGADGNRDGGARVGWNTARKRRPEAGQLKPSTSVEDRAKGPTHGKKPSWMSGWDCMARYG